MTGNYYKIGDYISVIDNRNTDGSITKLMGISIDKCYIPSVANVIGTDLSNYKVIRRGQFACSLMQVSRDQRIPIAMYEDDVPAIMSPAYVMFEVSRPDVLLPEYMELWFKRAEFDREASFYAVGGVRGSLDWEDFCKMELPVPPLPEQQEIVRDYKVITDRIALLRKISSNIEEMVSNVFNHFVLENEDYDDFTDFEFGRYPTAWSLKKMSEIVDVRDGTHDSPTAVADGHKLVTSVHLNPYSVNKTAAYAISDIDYIEINKRSVVHTWDILMSMIGTVGRLSLVTDDPVDYAIKNMALFKTSKLPQGLCFYLLSFLKSSVTDKYLSSFLAGSTQSYVSLETLRAMPVIIPSEQDLQVFIKTVEPMYCSLISFEKETQCLENIASKVCL